MRFARGNVIREITSGKFFLVYDSHFRYSLVKLVEKDGLFPKLHETFNLSDLYEQTEQLYLGLVNIDEMQSEDGNIVAESLLEKIPELKKYIK